MIGGAIGNLIDRLYLKGVIDSPTFRSGQAKWPTFNVADSAICVGIAVLLVATLFEKDDASHEEEPAAAADSVAG